MKPAESAKRREEGAALVVVMLLVIVIGGLIAYLVPLSNAQIRSQSNAARRAKLSLVLRSAIADAVNEIASNTDAEGDGLGARGTGLGGAAVDQLLGEGVPLRISTPDGGEEVLGYYRTTINMNGLNEPVMTVVAAYPDFLTPVPDGVREYLAAQLTLQPGGGLDSLFGRNAISFTGPMGNPDPDAFGMFENAVLDIHDLSRQVPAVNMSDSTFLQRFLDGFNPQADIQGQGGSGADSVTSQEGATILNNGVLNQLATAITNYAVDATPDLTFTGDDDGGRAITRDSDIPNYWNFGAPDEVYRMDSTRDMRLTDGIFFHGGGTLIIEGSLTVDDGATLVWDGDVILAGDARDAELAINGNVEITGNLVSVSRPNSGGRADIVMRNDALLEVYGNMLMIAPEGGEGEFRMDTRGGGRAHTRIYGISAFLGDTVDMTITADGSNQPYPWLPSANTAAFEVYGSIAVGVTEDAADGGGIQNLRYEEATWNCAIYDDANFTSGLELLGDFAANLPGAPGVGQWTQSSFLEVSGTRAADAQYQAIAAVAQSGGTLDIANTEPPFAFLSGDPNPGN